jgi:hypothetical protein
MRHSADIVRDGGDATVLRARGLRKHYGHGQGLVRAVDGSTSTSPPARPWR